MQQYISVDSFRCEPIGMLKKHAVFIVYVEWHSTFLIMLLFCFDRQEECPRIIYYLLFN
jgi:hypothetical protein